MYHNGRLGLLFILAPYNLHISLLICHVLVLFYKYWETI